MLSQNSRFKNHKFSINLLKEHNRCTNYIYLNTVVPWFPDIKMLKHETRVLISICFDIQMHTSMSGFLVRIITQVYICFEIQTKNPHNVACKFGYWSIAHMIFFKAWRTKHLYFPKYTFYTIFKGSHFL